MLPENCEDRDTKEAATGRTWQVETVETAPGTPRPALGKAVLNVRGDSKARAALDTGGAQEEMTEQCHCRVPGHQGGGSSPSPERWLSPSLSYAVSLALVTSPASVPDNPTKATESLLPQARRKGQSQGPWAHQAGRHSQRA